MNYTQLQGDEEQVREQWAQSDPELFFELESLGITDSVLFALHAGASVVLMFALTRRCPVLLHYQSFAKWTDAEQASDEYREILKRTKLPAYVRAIMAPDPGMIHDSPNTRQ
jgi:hypothetical protein